jgi:hypothetical protein
MSDTQTCPSCLGTGERLLPIRDVYGDPTVDAFPCPVCRVWMDGFPGETVVFDDAIHVVIEPSEPGELAVYRGFPEF